MKQVVQSVTIKIQKLLARKKPSVLSDQDKLRQSARITLKKYHDTFRKLAHE